MKMKKLVLLFCLPFVLTNCAVLPTGTALLGSSASTNSLIVKGSAAEDNLNLLLQIIVVALGGTYCYKGVICISVKKDESGKDVKVKQEPTAKPNLTEQFSILSSDFIDLEASDATLSSRLVGINMPSSKELTKNMLAPLSGKVENETPIGNIAWNGQQVIVVLERGTQNLFGVALNAIDSITIDQTPKNNAVDATLVYKNGTRKQVSILNPHSTNLTATALINGTRKEIKIPISELISITPRK